MPSRREPAPAKVNLFLHVGTKRSDGYHDLTSLVVFPEVGDVVTVSTTAVTPAKARKGREPGPIPQRARSEGLERADQWVPGLPRIKSGVARDDEKGEGISLKIAGPFAGDLRDDGPPPASPHSPQHAGGRMNNLVLLAAEALAAGRSVPGAKIVLTKNLPIASGIGGGSADAAAAIRVLNELWRLRLSKDRLREIGLSLGSDVPVCIDPKPQWMEGRGERVERGPRMPDTFMVLVNPGVPLATAGVFKALTKKSGAKRPHAPKSFSSALSLAAWLSAETRNDLQAPAIQIAPPIAEVLAQLDAQAGCLLARMSGSGATCFGLFASLREAKRAASAMPKTWWAKAAACGYNVFPGRP